jgi:hypothetical protein
MSQTLDLELQFCNVVEVLLLLLLEDLELFFLLGQLHL